MIISRNFFFIKLIPNFLIVKLNGNKIFVIYFLNKKKRIKLRFKKLKKKTLLINTTPYYKNYFVNYNKTIHFDYNKSKINNTYLFFLFKNKFKWIFNKFKYRGKGFKVKKFNRLSKITFRFGKSHWTKLIYNKKKLIVKRTKKNTYCCISIKKNIFYNFKLLIKKIKGVNKYTKRGVRLTRQLLKKRFGKISQASSVYNR